MHIIERRNCTMTKEVLLSTEFESAYAAMTALNAFLASLDVSVRAKYQNLKAIGNRIYE